MGETGIDEVCPNCARPSAPTPQLANSEMIRDEDGRLTRRRRKAGLETRNWQTRKSSAHLISPAQAFSQNSSMEPSS